MYGVKKAPSFCTSESGVWRVQQWIEARCVSQCYNNMSLLQHRDLHQTTHHRVIEGAGYYVDTS